MGYFRKAISLSLKGRTQTSVCTVAPAPWDADLFHKQNNVQLESSCSSSGGVVPSLTRSTPHLCQVAVRLPGLLAQVHHISAQCVRGNRNLSEMLVIVTEVNRQEHLYTAWGTQREKGTIKNTREILEAFVTAESTLGVTVIGGLFPYGLGCVCF